MLDEKQAKPKPEKPDIHHYRKKLEWSYRALEKETFPERDKQLIRELVDYIEANGVSPGRLTKMLYTMMVLRREMRCGFEALDRTEAERIMRWINGSDYKAWTKSDMKGALKRFQKWVRLKNLDSTLPFPSEVAWIKTTLKRNELEDPEILNDKEVEAMIAAAKNPRDRALIAVVYEGGFRVGELLGMRVKDVAFDQHGAKVSVRGKTGARIVRLVTSAPALSRWMEFHQDRGEPEAPVWYNYNGTPLGYLGASKIMKRLAKAAGVIKRVHPHTFRHSAATRDAKFLTEYELRVKYGWSNSSETPGRYVHLSGKDIDDKIISHYTGRPVESPHPEFALVPCTRCGTKCTPGDHFCGNCGTPLGISELAKSTVEIQELRNELQALRELDKLLTSA